MGEDPAVIRDALGNKEALEALTRRLIKAGQLITGGGGSAAVVAGDKANPFSTDFMSVNAGALQNITKEIKPSAKRKILDAANIQKISLNTHSFLVGMHRLYIRLSDDTW